MRCTHRSEEASESIVGLVEGMHVLPLKAVSKDKRRRPLLKTQKQQCKSLQNLKNQGNKTSKNHNNVPVIKPKDIDICELPNNTFKITVLSKVNQLQENTERQTKLANQYTNNMEYLKKR